MGHPVVHTKIAALYLLSDFSKATSKDRALIAHMKVISNICNFFLTFSF